MIEMISSHLMRGWSGGAKVLGQLPVPGRPTNLPIVLAVGAGGACLAIFSLKYDFSFLSPSLWETARYGLKYCLKWPISPQQPTTSDAVRNYNLWSCQKVCKALTFLLDNIYIRFGS